MGAGKRKILKKGVLGGRAVFFFPGKIKVMGYERTPAYVPGQKAAYKISRSKIELFTQCPRCFWLDARLKIKRPSSPPFQINKAIDELLKKEFDSYRIKGEPHPWMIEHEINAVPM